MILLIFLGILWLKYNTVNREGFDAAALSADMLTTINDKLTAGGFDTSTLKTALPGAFDQISQLVEQATTITGDTTGTGEVKPPTDLSNVIDTTGSDYYNGKTFFTGKRFSDGFCQTYSDPVERNNKCSALTAENCNQTDCCIVLNGNKCVAGDANGPTFLVDENGKDLDYAYYSYKNDCYGSCGKGLGSAANPCSIYGKTDIGISEKCIKRLWKQTGCPNTAYITSEIATSFKDNTKASLEVKFKNAKTDEPNYANCYGPIEEQWPVPCNGTTDTSYGLSGRCLKKLLADVGCENQDVINAEYVTANKLEPKSAMINVFTGWYNALPDDTVSLTKCYGSDPLQWPDPCELVLPTARLYRGEIPRRCFSKLLTNLTGCPATDYVTKLYADIAKMSEADKRSKDYVTRQWLEQKWTNDKTNNNVNCTLPMFQEVLLGVSIDNNVCIKKYLAGPWELIPNSGGMISVYSLPDGKLWGVGKDLQIYTRLGPFDTPWVRNRIDGNSGRVLTISKLNDGLIAAGDNGYFYTKKTFADEWQWNGPRERIGGGIIAVLQIQDGSVLAVTRDGSLYKKNAALTDAWVLIPNSEPVKVKSITQRKDGTFLGLVNEYNALYSKATLNADWVPVTNPGGRMISLASGMIYN
jgi:hypothetical protein